MKNRKPWSFCETPKEKCTMNYCDDNGCQNRKRHLVNEDHNSESPLFTKSITFDKEAQNNLPQHIKDKMKADREAAQKQ